MADDQSSGQLLETLKSSLSSASDSVPTSSALTSPVEGLSLLDTKNELFLSYLQNLVFLLLLKIRNHSSPSADSDQHALSNETTKKLVEIRLYLERGVKPLEAKLKYQLDKLLAAATEADAAASLPDTSPRNGAPATADEEASDDGTVPRGVEPEISDLSYRPNPAAFMKPELAENDAREDNTGIYRPPRITPTALPTTDRIQRLKRPQKSATVENFIREELTDAPLAESSIGAGSSLRGKERERDEERRAYEEQRLVRLPSEKKRRRQMGVIGDGGDDLQVGGYGGFDRLDFGDMKGKKKKKERQSGGSMKAGELWKKRESKGLKRRRR